MSRTKGWFGRTADDNAGQPAEKPAAPAPSQVPLEDADKNRQPPPANPTGNPEPPKPVSVSELMKQLEGAHKSMLDAGINIEKSAAGVGKVKAMAGVTEQERKIMAHADELAKKIAKLKQESSMLAEEISQFRETLGTQVSAGWTYSK